MRDHLEIGKMYSIYLTLKNARDVLILLCIRQFLYENMENRANDESRRYLEIRIIPTVKIKSVLNNTGYIRLTLNVLYSSIDYVLFNNKTNVKEHDMTLKRM